jgi:hypothetical protein
VPALLSPPKSLSHLTYFVVRCYRFEGRYELLEPGRAQSYVLGSAQQSWDYFKSVGLQELGARAMDAALAFGASQALIKENRAWGLDLCRIDLDRGVVRDRDIDEDRGFTPDEDGDDIIVLPGGQVGKINK